MSIHNRNISFNPTAEGFLAFDLALTGLKSAIEPVPEVDPALLKRVPKIGGKTETFTRQAVALAKENMDLLPRGLAISTIEADLATRDQLYTRYVAVQQFAKRLHAVITLMGSDAYSGGLAAYKAMKVSNRDESLRELLRDLGSVFAKAQEEQAGEEEPGTEDGPAPAGPTVG